MSFGAAFDLIRGEVERGRMPVAILGVADASGVLALDAFGSVDGRAATTGDFVPVFSVTKPLVGLAVLRALERGLLGLQDPLQGVLPEFGRGREDVVRLVHLLTHTAGIVEPALDAPEGLSAALLAPGRDFAAGTVSRYSSVAFEGARVMLEAATGRGFEELVAEVGTLVSPEVRFTFDADVDPLPIVETAENGLDWARFAALRHPGAGVYTRAADLLALGQSLLAGDGRIVHPGTLAASLRPQTAGLPKLEPYPVERGQDWGLTWNVRHSDPALLERGLYGHGGWAGCEWWMYPELGLTFVLLTNRPALGSHGWDASRLHNAVASGV
ncbi:serine hydrolase domain-containing protein [Herbiconiux sp. SYSU D00978]|uniref:serine hydrolase domain-containing protein n=1 Tax=Herbiconiux sp. SYSU D00978 TaxID=2812562 RepID=UPI0027DC3FE6|nr:serine hydrolase domain-containing protein [Herbiconiux sp. SYSU D00978]